jgi:hypothetical protein
VSRSIQARRVYEGDSRSDTHSLVRNAFRITLVHVRNVDRCRHSELFLHSVSLQLIWRAENETEKRVRELEQVLACLDAQTQKNTLTCAPSPSVVATLCS